LEYLEKYDGQTPTLSVAGRSLWRRLDTGLVEISLPENVVRHKQRKYDAIPTQAWKHPSDRLHFMFAVGGGRRSLMTVFDAISNYNPDKHETEEGLAA